MSLDRHINILNSDTMLSVIDSVACSMFYCCYTHYFIESCAMHTCTDVTRNKYNDTILIMTIIFY